MLPSTLVDHFVAIASANTDKGVETCGFLLGGLVSSCRPSVDPPKLTLASQSHNTFTVSHLLIPKQEGTPDTCMTTDEEEIYQFQDSRDLMTLGWVRSQLAFPCAQSLTDHSPLSLHRRERLLGVRRFTPTQLRPASCPLSTCTLTPAINSHSPRPSLSSARRLTIQALASSGESAGVRRSIHADALPCRMTDPPGLETIIKCKIKGLFHPQ